MIFLADPGLVAFVLTLPTSAENFDSDFSGLESGFLQLLFEILGGALRDRDFGHGAAVVADKVLGLVVVLTDAGAGEEAIGAWDEVHEAEFREDAEGSVDADDIHGSPGGFDMGMERVGVERAVGGGQGLKNLNSRAGDTHARFLELGSPERYEL